MSKRTKVISKLTMVTLSILLIVPMVKINAEEVDSSYVEQQIIETIEANTEYTKQGLSLEDDLKLELESLDVEVIKEEMKEIGLDENFIDSFDSDVIFELVNDNIQKINEDVKMDRIEIVNDDIVDVKDNNFYVQGGSTYSKKYSWGIKHYKSTAAANKFTYEMGRKINALNWVSALSFVCAPYGPPAGVAGVTASWYFTGIMNKVNYYNAKNSRGIILDIKTWLTYSVKNQ